MQRWGQLAQGLEGPCLGHKLHLVAIYGRRNVDCYRSMSRSVHGVHVRTPMVDTRYL